MERFNALSRGTKVMLVASVLLLIDSFLDWQQVEFSLLGQSTSTGVSGWHGIGVVMGLLTVVLIAWLLVRLAAVNLNLPVSDAMAGALLGFLVLAFTVIKVLKDNEFRHWPAWVGLILAVAIAVGAWLSVQEAGGMDTLKSEASTMGGSGGGGASAPPAAPPPPPPAAPAAPSEPAPHDHSAEGHSHGEGDRPA